MSTNNLERLTVLGAGVLGGQIAWQSAFRGKTVVVYDLHEAGLRQCRTAQETYSHIYQQEMNATAEQMDETRARISFTTDLAASVADADVVIEAVPDISHATELGLQARLS